MLNVLLLKRIIILLITIVVLDTIAFVFYLHWIFWWYDVMLHFLAGFSIGMTAVLVWGYFFDVFTTNKIKIICVTLIGAFVVGILWETYEVIWKETSLSDGIFYWRDTISDLILDVFGNFFGVLYSWRITNKI